jgi:hypothetical protein
MIIGIVLDNDTPAALDWVYSFFPFYHIHRLLTHALINLGTFAHGPGYYWTYNMTQPTLVIQ